MIPQDMYDVTTPNDRALYMYLAHEAGANLLCWPTRSEIARGSGLSVGEIRTSELHLKAGGWLEMEPWRTLRGDHASSVYVLYPKCRDYTSEDLKLREFGHHTPPKD